MHEHEGETIDWTITHDVLKASAREQARALRARKVTSFELVRWAIERTVAVDKSTHAVVDECFARALKEAMAADAVLSTSDEHAQLPPFLGVPISIKEAFAVAGMSHTASLKARAHRKATADAPVVRRLRDAGFIVICVSATSELCMWMESVNRARDACVSNPYDLSRTCGGSSGGEAVLVASCATAVGLGSDVGGSIRMPAAFNGIFGHKPTSFVVDNAGQVPNATDAGQAMLVTGPLARRAKDLWPLLRAMANEDVPLQSTPDDVRYEDLVVFSVHDNGAPLSRVSDELRREQRSLEQFLRAQGALVLTEDDDAMIELPHFADSVSIWSTLMSDAGGSTFAQLLCNEGEQGVVDGGAISSAYHLLLSLFGVSPYTLPALLLALVESLPNLPLLRRLKPRFRARGSALRRTLTQLLNGCTRASALVFPRADGSVDVRSKKVLLYPSFVSTAPYHHQPLLVPLHFAYTAIWNAMQLPVTQVPLTLSTDTGLPIGIQIVAGEHCDAVSIGVAQLLEKDGRAGHRIPQHKK